MLAAYIILRLLWRLEYFLRDEVCKISVGTFRRREIMFSDKNKTLDDIEILYDSSHFLVVNKSCDVIVNHKDQTREVTVQKQLERLYPDLINPSLKLSFYFPHRLDYATSGILCIAKHKKACAAAVKSFEERKAKKFYIAIVRGWISQDTLMISEPIGEDIRDDFQNLRMAVKSSPFCSSVFRDANTNLVVLEKGLCCGYPATKIVLRPLTGRRHQLRLHLSSIGHTIVGDFTYSNRTDLHPYRMFLHAMKLILPNDLENLSLSTKDPFTSDDKRNEWVPKETRYSLQEAIGYLEKDSG